MNSLRDGSEFDPHDQGQSFRDRDLSLPALCLCLAGRSLHSEAFASVIRGSFRFLGDDGPMSLVISVPF
ncbi:hypothetical protein LZ554_000395 [Drepanopeziza brunnea f. sp. 'monogermtubi']|nr:hypothetical protein LZ554_000395 [Drepanopeziza brunnea f. sp. 'monogermtubi']